jgi:hypothetical protein
VKEAKLTPASAASGRREHAQRHASFATSLARTRNSWPIDPSAQRFKPDRLFRRQPRFHFERGEGGVSWRELILPEKALRSAASGRPSG